MQDLTFEDKSIRVIEKDGQVWLGAADIARALEYNRADKVTRLYERHAAEFTDSMTKIVETPTLGHPGNLLTKTRVFSLRGAHLVAMFARTSKGQAFRRWLLDMIEQGQSPAVTRSLVQDYFDALVDLKAQDKFASLCGKGLSEHKRIKPPLKERCETLLERMTPSLFAQLECAH